VEEEEEEEALEKIQEEEENLQRKPKRYFAEMEVIAIKIHVLLLILLVGIQMKTKKMWSARVEENVGILSANGNILLIGILLALSNPLVLMK